MIMHSTTDGRTSDKCIINLAYPDSGEMAVAVPTAFLLVNAEFSAVPAVAFLNSPTITNRLSAAQTPRTVLRPSMAVPVAHQRPSEDAVTSERRCRNQNNG
jgi:hypothetical protein